MNKNKIDTIYCLKKALKRTRKEGITIKEVARTIKKSWYNEDIKVLIKELKKRLL